MTTFKGGPAEGTTLTLKRRPILLRVVQGRGGEIDALDMPEDEPGPGEVVTVYILAGVGPSGFLDGRGKDGRRWGTSFAAGTYRLCPFQPSGDEGNSRALFEAWCASNEAAARELHGQLIAEVTGL